MWEQGGYDNAGGFMNQSQADGGATPGGSAKKMRAQNLVPVNIRNILDCGEDGLKVEGIDAGMVSIVGKILSVDKAETKSTYSLEDDSGKIDAVHWIDESTGGRVEEGVVEGSIARVVGSVRAQGDKRYLIVFRICSVIGDEEVDAHKLEILHSKLQIKNMNEKENAAIGANYGLSNSMVGGSTTTSNSSSFGNSKHDSVYKMVSGCDREEGMGRDELFQSLSSKMNKKDVDDALEFLSNEGHVYSTTDEDHFKTTDS